MILGIAFLTTLATLSAPQTRPAEEIEPPLELTLQIGNTSVPAPLEQDLRVQVGSAQVAARLSMKPYRILHAGEVRLEYPSYFGFKLTNDPEVIMWGLDGKKCSFGLFRLPRSRDPEGFLERLEERVTTSYAGRVKKREPATVRLGAKVLKGRRVQIEAAGFRRRLEVCGFTTEAGSYVFMLQDDSAKADWGYSDEAATAMDRIARTFEIREHTLSDTGAGSEPEAVFEVEIDGQRADLRLGKPSRLMVRGQEMAVTLTAKPFRIFQARGIRLHYPASFRFEAKPASDRMTWRFVGIDSMVAVVHGTLKPGEELVRDYEQHMVQLVGSSNVLAQADVSFSFGSIKASGRRLDYNVPGSVRRQDIYGFTVGDKHVALVIADKLNADGSGSAEAKKLMEMLKETLVVGRAQQTN